MHMADALLSPQVGASMWAATIGLEAYALNRLGREDVLESRKIPVMGVTGAFVFAAQMINFAIPATGSSGHLGGGLLLAALLGPYAGFIVLSIVLAIQALFFADGGLLALGANIFNMGFFTCFLAYPLITRPILVKGRTKPRIFASSVTGAVLGLLFGAFFVVLETTASGITELPFFAFASLMLPIHLAIGVVEGVVTALVLVFINNEEPSLIEVKSTESIKSKSVLMPSGAKKAVAVLAVCAVLLAGVVSRFASEHPDGLEWAIERTASAEPEADGVLYETLASVQEKTGFLPDYGFKPREPAPDADASSLGLSTSPDSGIDDIGGSVAGLVGSAMVLLAAAGAGFVVMLSRRKARR